ncbi:hypothetical protein DACRYDRAFT_117875 [Dacryopinax primogenitus]|uniref:Uncharacterized protein n=1 Tax=Dacryopinax primogenitus (strain DJM 731) TaxID=1858805 RepID=M5G1I6_DACPD|nr:uncharacterized protein DACRYDRAFT_117875 [Dacryopinax primogenitus]EJT99686.1 hypothetical protein DACRYDRAFT_117875 [Dacryopinax primogenitus]
MSGPSPPMHPLSLPCHFVGASSSPGGLRCVCPAYDHQNGLSAFVLATLQPASNSTSCQNCGHPHSYHYPEAPSDLPIPPPIHTIPQSAVPFPSGPPSDHNLLANLISVMAPTGSSPYSAQHALRRVQANHAERTAINDQTSPPHPYHIALASRSQSMRLRTNPTLEQQHLRRHPIRSRHVLPPDVPRTIEFLVILRVYSAYPTPNDQIQGRTNIRFVTAHIPFLEAHNAAGLVRLLALPSTMRLPDLVTAIIRLFPAVIISQQASDSLRLIPEEARPFAPLRAVRNSLQPWTGLANLTLHDIVKESKKCVKLQRKRLSLPIAIEFAPTYDPLGSVHSSLFPSAFMNQFRCDTLNAGTGVEKLPLDLEQLRFLTAQLYLSSASPSSMPDQVSHQQSVTFPASLAPGNSLRNNPPPVCVSQPILPVPAMGPSLTVSRSFSPASSSNLSEAIYQPTCLPPVSHRRNIAIGSPPHRRTPVDPSSRTFRSSPHIALPHFSPPPSSSPISTSFLGNSPPMNVCPGVILNTSADSSHNTLINLLPSELSTSTPSLPLSSYTPGTQSSRLDLPASTSLFSTLQPKQPPPDVLTTDLRAVRWRWGLPSVPVLLSVSDEKNGDHTKQAWYLEALMVTKVCEGDLCIKLMDDTSRTRTWCCVVICVNGGVMKTKTQQ